MTARQYSIYDCGFNYIIFRLTDCQPFEKEAEIDISTLEFLLVNCSGKSVERKKAERSSPYEFHYNLPMSHEPLQEKLKFWNQRPTDSARPISIKFLLLDSISRPHGLRSLPKTVSYLKDKLGFIEFKGYHALGEPTIHNYVPMMMGIATDHVGWEKKPPHYEGKWDSEPFIWHNFSQLNYVTMDAEDMAYWHTFHFNGRKGFTKRQMDFNTRPYFLIQEEIAKMTQFTIKYSDKLIKYNALNCVDRKNVWDFLLDYTYEFLEKFQNVPTFSITWWGWPNHDFLPATQVFDEPFVNFFQKLESSTSVLDNTIVILMGDHGFRWSNYSETKEGLLERNLPFFMIRLPPKFKEAYPEMAANLAQNSQRLTTHVDLFQTLAHLHRLMTPVVFEKEVHPNPSYGYNAKYGTSLFTNIPPERTCEDARIPQRFCSCNYPLWDEDFKYANYKKAMVVEGLSSLAESQKNAKNAPKNK